ncbi:TetR family transcriptional regulator [bacterium]|nr:TetR family transcriptional regulator [bacterium]
MTGAKQQQADATRAALIAAGAAEIHRKGFGAASVDAILRDTGVTKGALYHHFGSKAGLGHAVVDEVVRPFVEAKWKPMLAADHPLAAAIEYVNGRIRDVTEEELALGCPYNNLVQELGSLDEGFKTRLHSIFFEWRQGLADCVRKSQACGEGRADVDPDAAAAFIISAIEGCYGMGKATRCRKTTVESLQGMVGYLQAMKA